MSDPVLTANEIEALILKAARGGGLPLGHAEDLAAAGSFLDLNALSRCPCSGDVVGALVVPLALDRLIAGRGPQTVDAEPALVAAYVAVADLVWGKRVIWEAGPPIRLIAVREGRKAGEVLGRRSVPQSLADHLTEMAARTLVPETEASRLVGAGAGLTDND